MRLLIVDQDPAFRKDLVSLVERRGHAVTNVASGAEARAALEQEEFDVLFTGLRLDSHNGMALLADTRHRWPRMSVVMLTDSATVEEAVKALHQGAFDYLKKPVQPAQVHRVLELVSQELALRTKGAPLRDPVEYARALAAEGG
jgi:DNA-binding NtrC family response regulator